MPFLENAEQTIQLIQEKSGKSLEEIQELVQKKKEKYSGMLTESGAAFLVAKELGIELELEKKISEKASIASLEQGMNNIDLEVRVLQAFQAREFEKNGRKGKLINLIVGDSTGEIRLTLWHNDARRFEEEKIEKGSKLLLSNCNVLEFQGKKQLSLDYNGKFSLVEAGSEKAGRIEELKEGMQNIDLIARIVRVFPQKKFVKEAREGRIANFEINDGKNTIRATAWNELAKELEKLEANDLVKIENAYTKQGLKGIELHLGWQARIIKNPKTSLEIPEVQAIGFEREKFNALEENQNFEQRALVLDLNFGKIFFEVCPKCGKKPQGIEGKLVCDNCGQIESTEKRIFVFALLDDGTVIMRAAFFGKTAEEFLGITSKELQEKEKNGKLNETLEKLLEKIVGEEIKIQGTARTNLMSGKLEITARNAKIANAEQEAKAIIKELAS